MKTNRRTASALLLALTLGLIVPTLATASTPPRWTELTRISSATTFTGAGGASNSEIKFKLSNAGQANSFSSVIFRNFNLSWTTPGLDYFVGGLGCTTPGDVNQNSCLADFARDMTAGDTYEVSVSGQIAYSIKLISSSPTTVTFMPKRINGVGSSPSAETEIIFITSTQDRTEKPVWAELEITIPAGAIKEVEPEPWGESITAISYLENTSTELFVGSIQLSESDLGGGGGSQGGGQGSSGQSAPTSAPAKYSGPEFSSLSLKPVMHGSSTTLTGKRLSQVSSIEIGGKAATFTSISDTELSLTPAADLAPGTYDLVIHSSAGKLTHINAVRVQTALRPFSITTRSENRITETQYYEHSLIAAMQQPELTKARCIVNGSNLAQAKAQAERLCALVRASNKNIETTVVESRSTVKNNKVYARVTYGWN